jgi:ankyrin repeat protein
MECTDVGLARRLLELGVDVHARDADGMDALLFACKRGNVELASLLLTSGASVYSVNGTGMSALALACEGGHAEVVELLLYTEPELGDEDARAQWVAWLFAEDGSGWNAMHWAAAGSHRGCVQALLDIGFDANLPDTEGVTPLHLVDDVEVARILLDEGAEDLSDDYGHTAASRACESSSRVEVLRLLLQRFPDSDHPDRPLLFDAAQAGNLEAVRLLLAARPPGYINKRGFSGGSALHFTKDPEAVRLLLELGIDPRIVDNEGKTSIMSSFEAACVRLLLDAAPDLVGARDLEGRTAVMHLSCSGMHYKALEELFRYCEERGVDAGVNIKDLNGDTALHIAMIGGCLPAVELLLEKGAEVLNSGCGGTTALMKPLLDEAAIQSTYNELYFHWMTDTRDTNAAACVRALLDAVLRGGEVDGGASCEAQEDAVNDEE